MRRFFLCLAVLITLTVMAVMSTRLTRAEQAARTLHEATLSAACEAMEQLTTALDTLALTTTDAPRMQALLTAARSGNMARTSLAALPMAQEDAACIQVLLNVVTAHADALLQASTADAPTLAALLHQRTACRRLCTQLQLCSSEVLTGQANAADPALYARLSAAVCADGVHDSLVPVLTRPVPRALPKGEITQADALLVAADVLADRSVLRAQAAPDTSGVLPAYGVTVDTADLRLSLEITHQGGKLLWMMPENAAFPVLTTAEDCRSAIRSFLQRQGFDAMQEVAWQMYDGLYVAAMVPVQEDMLLYPDLLHVQVRMDTAQVVGFEAAQYWTNHASRALAQPRLTAQEAAAELPAAAELISAALCVLETAAGEELCYQLQAQLEDIVCLVYISAMDGRQLAVRELLASPDGMILS